MENTTEHDWKFAYQKTARTGMLSLDVLLLHSGDNGLLYVDRSREKVRLRR